MEIIGLFAWACPSLRSGRHLTGFASLMASPPLRGPPGGSRKNTTPQGLPITDFAPPPPL